MTTTLLNTNDVHKLEALTPKGWPSITSYFEFYTSAIFCFPIKIVSNNEIVGIGTTIFHENTVWLAHIIVHPDYRNKGIGKTITKALIAQAQKKDCKTILLIATELGAYVYEKLGFETEVTYFFYKVSKNIEKHIHSTAVVSYTDKMKEDFLAFDKKISGENREENIIPHLKNSFVFLNNNIIEGIFIPTLGEGLIIAETSTAGIELLKLRLNTHQNVIVPKNNSVAIDYMNQNKHEIVYKAKRMRLGNSIPVQLQHIYARIGGNLG